MKFFSKFLDFLSSSESSENNNSNNNNYLEAYLTTVEFKNNLDEDFSVAAYWPYQKIDDRNNFSFNNGKEDISFCKHSDDGTTGKLGVNYYSSFSVIDRRFEQAVHGVTDNRTSSILILPYFFCIDFFKELNLFVCSRQTEFSKKMAWDQKWDLYYFDIKGRFLKHEIGLSYSVRLPSIAFINNPKQEILEISPIPIEKYLKKIISNNLFELGERDKMGLYDGSMSVVLDCVYEKIVVDEKQKIVIAQENKEVIKINLKSKKRESLGFTKIIDTKNNEIRVKCKKEWSILDKQGNIIMPKKFNYIESLGTKNCFKVFKGKYSWNKFPQYKYDKLVNLFYEGWDNSFIGILKKGKWGIINKQSEVIIPLEYDWIEEQNENTFISNIGGKVVKYYNGDIKKKEIAVVGGKWQIHEIIEKRSYSVTYEEMKKFKREKLPDIDSKFRLFTDKDAWLIDSIDK